MRQRIGVLAFVLFLSAVTSRGQSPTAVVNGQVRDTSGAAIPGATVVVINDATGIRISTETNAEGIYSVPNLSPGTYRIQVSKQGFKTIVHSDIVLHVQDAEAIGFTLPVGTASDTVTVEGGAPLVNTQDAAVSTVLDRTFMESLPLNGRSFNILLQLTPGVVIASNGGTGLPGQYSIAGQRTSANNFTVDGVSGNFGVNPFAIVGSGTGSAQAFSALGGTSSLVSVDALQEFRIVTSSFSPEFGKAPGGQVILTTRSGTNDFHGGIFDYFRNEAMDANDWFANAAGLPRPQERHNDFGGFLGGHLLRDRTFFFFSYEGARLKLPNTQATSVPSSAARNGTTTPAASPAIMPFLNTYPQPNGPVSPNGFTAKFTGAFSNTANLDATSIRIDHKLNDKFSIFGRYNDAPSQVAQRIGSLNTIQTALVNTRTVTIGANMVLSSLISNSARGNYSTQRSNTIFTTDSFGGAVPLAPSLLLGGLPAESTYASLLTLGTGVYDFGPSVKNKTQQINIADDLSVSTGSHVLKFGGDYRLILLDAISAKNFTVFFSPTVQTLISTIPCNGCPPGGATLISALQLPAYLSSHSLSLYGQDTWEVTPRLTLTYGLRWEFAPAPGARQNTTIASWINTDDPANLALAPFGTPLWKTTYSNFAPRAGIAYRLNQGGDFLLRLGGGVFYDLGSENAAAASSSFPNFVPGNPVVVALPVSHIAPDCSRAPEPCLPTFSTTPPFPTITPAFSQNLKLPRSYQWNLALEKSFGGRQALSATYVGQAGRDLSRTKVLYQPNANFPGSDFYLTDNSAYSNYHSLQIQYRRPVATGLHALASYTWSHSLDNASNDVAGAFPNSVVSNARDYASSDFDVRHSFSGALTYDVPAAVKSGPLSLLTRNWSLDTIVVARSGFPFNALLILAPSPDPLGLLQVRPDRVAGQPVWVPNATAPGGKMLNVTYDPNTGAINGGAFSVPSTIRQGTEGRNDIAGFGLMQVDLSVGRRFALGERLHLQFRADAFNLLNHPNFSNPGAAVDLGAFETVLTSAQMLNQGLGGLNPLFQEGGPRSLQLSLKLSF